MQLGIIDADLLDNGTRHPNLACMKIAAYYIKHGWDVVLLESYDDLDQYDLVSISRVFSFTKVPPVIYKDGKSHEGEEHPELFLKDNIQIGGTGFYYEKAPDLPYEIEHMKPYYDLYKDYIQKKIDSGEPRKRYCDYLDFSIGFATRGCFRKCEFCVNKKYDRVFKASPISEFLDESRPRIYLWDDNFMASPDFNEILDELISTGRKFQFRQGLDMRLMTHKKAEKLSQVNYFGDYIFAFDHIEEKKTIEKKLKIWRTHNSKSTKLYVLTGYDSQDEIDIENTFERIRILMKYSCVPYIMRYEEYKESRFRSMYVQLARWCNQPAFVKKQSFRQYCENNERYHRAHTKNPRGNCSCYQTMLDFEAEFPTIAKKYFDLRMEDITEYPEVLGKRINKK